MSSGWLHATQNKQPHTFGHTRAAAWAAGSCVTSFVTYIPGEKKNPILPFDFSSSNQSFAATSKAPLPRSDVRHACTRRCRPLRGRLCAAYRWRRGLALAAAGRHDVLRPGRVLGARRGGQVQPPRCVQAPLKRGLRSVPEQFVRIGPATCYEGQHAGAQGTARRKAPWPTVSPRPKFRAGGVCERGPPRATRRDR